MERLKRFEEYKYNQEDMMLEEWKLPTFQNTMKRKLSFLKSIDLTELEPESTHQMEIKELWRKIMKKIYTKDQAGKYIELVDNFDVLHLNNILEMIKRFKDSLENNTDVGYLLYMDDQEKFYYEKAFKMP